MPVGIPIRWTPEMDADLLDPMLSINGFCEKYRMSSSTQRRRRARLHCQRRKSIAWTAEMDVDLLSHETTNSEFKEKWGVCPTQQAARREKLRKRRPIGAPPSSRMLLAIPYIGTATDSEIGERFGISDTAIGKFRRKHGIDRFHVYRQCENCGNSIKRTGPNVSPDNPCWCDCCQRVRLDFNNRRYMNKQKLNAAMSAIQAAITKHESDKNDGANYE